MIWFCITPERELKTERIMRALAAGWGERGEVIIGAPPDDGNPFVVWGQRWLAEQIIPKAYSEKRPFWHVDNGYFRSAKGSAVGYYRITHCRLWPLYLSSPDYIRAREFSVNMRPWRKIGNYILFAHPGPYFGKAIGLEMTRWTNQMDHFLRRTTSRPYVVRPKKSNRPLDRDLKRAFALVTHSSNIAVDAVINGVPVFVEPTCPAAPVGAPISSFEFPVYPDRERWWASLMCQQFTLEEMASGKAHNILQMVIAEEAVTERIAA